MDKRTAQKEAVPLLGGRLAGLTDHLNARLKQYRPQESIASWAFLIGYDRSVPRLRQADHCIGCNRCTHHCPQSIDIPAQMQRINGFVEQLKQGIF